MPEPKLISPLLDGFAIGDPISDHHGVCCCPALSEETNERFIVKIISIPASQTQLDALLLTGAFSAPEQALSYFEDLARDVLSEAEILGKLTRLEGFLPYTGSQLIKMDDGVGYQVYLISPYKRSLQKHMQISPLTHLGALNLSLDLCAALASSRRAGYLYVDLKPNNIFLTQTQGWRVGDLGFVPLTSLKYASLPEKYRSEYTAPEISDAMSELNSTMDIYALGLVLYQVYNNGQLPFEGTAPAEPLPPPMYADYELAEIILKACDPNPAKRWTDPAQMGQALVSYMQRNSVNDTPIVPPPVVVEPEPVEPPEEEFLEENENAAALDELVQTLIEEEPPILEDLVAEPEAEVPAEEEPQAEDSPYEDEELAFIVDVTASTASDETMPSDEIVDELGPAFVSQEVEEMLAQADELISHELPEPAVAPDPIDVPFPAPITLEETAEPDAEVEENAEGSTDDTSGEDVEVETAEPEAVEENEPESDESEPLTIEDLENEESDSDDEEDFEDDEDEEDYLYAPPERERRKRRSNFNPKPLIIVVSIIAFLVAAGFGLSFYYQHYYLQTVESIDIDGGVDTISVQIHSDIDDALLKVVCTDTYGNARASDVKNGAAEFTELTPNTQYRILVEISGAHKLTGTTSGSFTTASQIEVLNFSAISGPEDGSIILNFAVNGTPEPETWILHYSGSDVGEQTLTFTGHTATITGLTVGNEYRFSLEAEGEQHLTGNRELVYTAQKILHAQSLRLLSCGDGIISLTWDVPENAGSRNWIIRCYSDNGFDESLSTTETTVEFSVPDHESSYTIEVTAEGMTSSSSLSVSPNPITVTDVTEKVSSDGTVELAWTYTGTAPADGWTISYSVDNTAAISLECAENAAVLPYYPGSHYEIDVRPVTDTTYLSIPFSYDAPKAASFNKYRVSADDLSFYMCLTPERENWDRFDVPAEFYRKDYAVGEKASFLVEVWTDYKEADDTINISYIVRDQDGAPVSYDAVPMVWSEMWDNRFCELDIPRMPAVEGKYTIEIYFNGAHVTTEKFNIT